MWVLTTPASPQRHQEGNLSFLLTLQIQPTRLYAPTLCFVERETRPSEERGVALHHGASLSGPDGDLGRARSCRVRVSHLGGHTVLIGLESG